MIGTLIQPCQRELLSAKRGRIEAPRPVEARTPVGSVDTFYAYGCSRAWRMEKAPVPEVDADMRVRPVTRVVEHQIAWLEFLRFDGRSHLAQRRGARGQQHSPCALEYVSNKAAAVETGLGRAAAVAVLHAQRLQGVDQGPIAIRGRAVVPGQGRQAEKPCEQEKRVSDNGQVHEAKDGAFMGKG